MIKVVAIVLFIVLGLALLVGLAPPGHRLTNLTAHGGFLPDRMRGVWMAMVFVIFSFIGTEVVAVTAGEAKDPQTCRAARNAPHGRPPDRVLLGVNVRAGRDRAVEPDPARARTSPPARS